MNHLIISHAIKNAEIEKQNAEIEKQNDILKKENINLSGENKLLQDEINKFKKELDFYKSLFTTRRNSCIFNLKIKKINGKNVWVDRVRDQYEDFILLDEDEEVKEWLKPIKCER